MAKLFDFPLVFSEIPDVLKYLPVTLELTLLAGALGLALGFLIAVIRMKKIPVLSQLAVLFVSVIRGTPIIVQLYISYFGIPIFLQYINYLRGTDYNVNNIPGFVFAMVALGLNQSAFDSETIRSALQSVDRGQIEAARSLGMTNGQVYRRVILPQALSVALLPLGNSFIGLIKGTSLAFTCSVVEITASAKIIAGRTYRFFEAYCTLAIIYWVLTLILERVIHLIEKKTQIPAVLPERDADGNIIRKERKWHTLKSEA